MVNSRAINERAKERGVTRDAMAIALDVAKPTVSQKINNKRPMFLDEAKTLQGLLGINDAEFCGFFFCE